MSSGTVDRAAIARHTALDLLEIGAVFLRPDEPFTWASGIRSPIYCDCRLTLSAPEVRGHIEASLAEIVRDSWTDCDAIMGTSTAGIPHAAIIGHLMGLPMGYVRGGDKDHGRQNRIEGRLEPGWRVAVIEDLISTGGSAIEVCEVLKEAGAEVLGIAAIFTYGMVRGIDNLSAANITCHTLTNFDVLVEVAAENGYIAESDIARLRKFRDNPNDESWITAK